MCSEKLVFDHKETRTFLSLPFELQLTIYECLKGDRRSLCSFSQTCREIRKGSVRMIFRDMPEVRDASWLEPFRNSSSILPHHYLEHLSRLTLYSYNEPTYQLTTENGHQSLPQTYPPLCLPNLKFLTLHFKQSFETDRVGYNYLRPFKSLLPLLNPKELTIGLKNDPDRFFLWLPRDEWEACTNRWTRLGTINQTDGTMICQSDKDNSVESLTEYKSILDGSSILSAGKNITLRFPMYYDPTQTASGDILNEEFDATAKLFTIWNSNLFSLSHHVTIEFIFRSQTLIDQARTSWIDISKDNPKCTVLFSLNNGKTVRL